MSGDTIFVGAPRAFGTATSSGLVYIYRHTGNAWEQTARLVACDGESYDRFGDTIAADADLLVVGAVWALGSGESAEAVYLYERVVDEWVESARLVSPQGLANEYFGSALAVSNDTIAVGSSGSSGSGQPGSVYLFQEIGNDWMSIATLVPPVGDNAPYFGKRVDLGTGMVLAGAYGEDSLGAHAGATYLFEYDGAAWTLTTKRAPATQSPGALFGSSVSVTDDGRILIASRKTVNGDGQCMANVFDYIDAGWSLGAQYMGSSDPVPSYFRYSAFDTTASRATGIQVPQANLRRYALRLRMVSGSRAAVSAVSYVISPRW